MVGLQNPTGTMSVFISLGYIPLVRHPHCLQVPRYLHQHLAVPLDLPLDQLLEVLLEVLLKAHLPLARLLEVHLVQHLEVLLVQPR